MLRSAFWALLFLNAALFAYGQGLLGTGGGEHEPARLKRQFNTPKLVVLTAEQAAVAAKAAPAPTAPGDDAAATETAPAVPEAPAPAPAAPAPAPAQALACLDIGTLSAGEARRFEARLAALDLGERQTRQAVQAQDVNSWLVNIPPQGSKEAADRKAAELRGLGVENFYIINGDSPMKFAISLGVFKTESGAQALLAQLNKQGVHSARITPRGPQTTHYTYRIRGLDEATRKRIAGYAERYDDVAVRNCR